MSTATTSGSTVEHFVTRARRLYSLPAVAVRVLELTGQPYVDTSALTECIEHDPALTSRILRVVNSSVFGISQRVGSLRQAVAMLGVRPLKMLVLGFSLPSNLASGPTTQVLALYWRHTLLKAVAAREIAETWYRVPPDEAFLGGLLQNLGMLVLVQDLGPTYEKFLVSVWEECGDLAAEESSVLGFDHQFLTARLLEYWRLPEEFVEAIGMPMRADATDTVEPTGGSLPRILHLAELTATFLVDPRPARLAPLLRLGKHSCGLTVPQLEALIAALQAKAPQLAEVLALEIPGGTSYGDLLQDASRRLAQLLDSTPPGMLQGTSAKPEPFPRVDRDRAKGGDEPGSRREAIGGQSAPRRTGEESQGAPAASRPSSGGQSAAALPPGETLATASERQASLSSEFSWMTREGLISRLSIAVGRCRQTRSSLSLLLVELDDVERVTFYCGPDRMPHVVRMLGVTICDSAADEGSIYQIEDARFALLLDGCERRRAVELGWRIVDGVRLWKFPNPTRLQAGFSVSAGLATLTMPPRNFPAEEILTAAQRCLSGVQLSGGNGLKSIDIY